MNLTVSVILPVYNEEKYISNCIESLLKQTFPKKEMEIIFLDGNSDDRTVSIISSYSRRDPDFIRVINNPNRTQAYAMNIGIREAKGKYIIRLDAHSDYDEQYISECVRLLDTEKYQNVGGVAETCSRTKFGQLVALMMSSKFGVGNSQFRTSSEGGVVDTVPFGAFRKDYLLEIGGFDERLDRNEDNEINFRIRKRGGIVYLSPTIKFKYYCRDTLDGILKMAFQNGKWTVIASKLCPGSMSLRHLIPFIFVLSLITLIPLSFVNIWFCRILIFELVLYCSLSLIFSLKTNSDMKSVMKLALLFPAFHISYGCGSLFGMVKMLGRNYR